MKRPLRIIINQVPNSLTLLNLLSGSLAIVLSFRGYLLEGSILVLLGFVFDLFDGMAARLLQAQSPIGKELDSLADLITFGLAPAAMLFVLQEQTGAVGTFTLNQSGEQIFLTLLPFLLPVFAGLRLAKFNIDDRQTNQFIGLPTPANGLMVLSLVLTRYSQPDSFLVPALQTNWFIPAYSVVVSYLMVSPLRLYSLKIKGTGIKANRFTYLFLCIAIAILIPLQATGLFLLIPVYIIYAAILSSVGKH
jgi:CDP-diacylglycerol--serine O-phosphatidyltransferase